ncbi:MAG: PEP-CTERM sorting domain-containing protein [Coleofasciculus sp. G1-WW12-02]|uniref:PEP-CTERM sorting domain-containing protein n=1 Tax=Coleofasciculus sp. G1-WW12-02 TaxID=3068483 RepID=UPI0032FB37C6
MKKFVRVLQQIAVATLAVVAANSAEAAIIGSRVRGGYVGQPETNLELQIVEPPAEGIRLGNFDNFDDGYTVDPNPNAAVDLFGIIEKQSIVLPQSIDVWDRFDRQTPSNFNVTIPKDTLVSSYLFYVQPPGGDNPKFEWSGQIRFDAPVLGIVSGYSNKSSYQPTTELVGLENTTYRIGAGLDRRQGDVVTFEDNVLTFFIESRSGTEPFRVISSGTPTVSVPEPITILGSGVALGVGVLFRSMTKKQKAE